MKRLLVVLIGVCYLVAGAGFTLRQHYCMGQLTGTAIEHPARHAGSHLCAKCGMEQKSDDNGCCNDKVKTFKSAPDQALSKAPGTTPFLFMAGMPSVAYPLLTAEHIDGLPRSPGMPAHGGPPGLASLLPLYLQVCCLRL